MLNALIDRVLEGGQTRRVAAELGAGGTGVGTAVHSNLHHAAVARVRDEERAGSLGREGGGNGNGQDALGTKRV